MFTRAALCTLGAHPFQRPRTPCLLMMFKKACLVLWTLGRYWINITLVCRNVKNKSGLHGINIYSIKICTSWHHELQSKNKRTIIHNYKVSLTFLVSPPDVTATHFRLSNPLKLIKLGVDLRWGPQLPLYPPHFRYWPLPPKFIRYPQKSTSSIASLSASLSCFRKGAEDWGVTVTPPPILFSFSHSHTSHSQCNCYNRSCLWRRYRKRLYFPWSTLVEWRNIVALLFTDTSMIQTTVHWREFLRPGKYFELLSLGLYKFLFFSMRLSWGSCSE